MGVAILEVPPPASVNKTARGYSPQARHKRKRTLQRDIAEQLLANNVPRPLPGGRARATAVLLFPTDRGRDEGNYRAPLEKALGDALAPAPSKEERRLGLDPLWVYLPDDTPDRFTFGAVTFEVTPLEEYLAGDGRKVKRRRPAVARIRLVWGEDLAAELEREARELAEALAA